VIGQQRDPAVERRCACVPASLPASPNGNCHDVGPSSPSSPQGHKSSLSLASRAEASGEPGEGGQLGSAKPCNAPPAPSSEQASPRPSLSPAGRLERDRPVESETPPSAHNVEDMAPPPAAPPVAGAMRNGHACLPAAPPAHCSKEAPTPSLLPSPPTLERNWGTPLSAVTPEQRTRETTTPAVPAATRTRSNSGDSDTVARTGAASSPEPTGRWPPPGWPSGTSCGHRQQQPATPSTSALVSPRPAILTSRGVHSMSIRQLKRAAERTSLGEHGASSNGSCMDGMHRA
jgi:hypothetical protein